MKALNYDADSGNTTKHIVTLVATMRYYNGDSDNTVFSVAIV